MSDSGPNVVSRLNLLDRSSIFEVEFELMEKSSVSLTLCDAAGLEKRTLIVERDYVPGTHRAELPELDFANEIYYYRLVVRTPSGRITDTKRITIGTPA